MALPLGPGSVVVAGGGALGIAAELVTALASRFRPKIYLLGGNPLNLLDRDAYVGDDMAFLAQRPHWIRRRLAARPGGTVATLNDEFDQMVNARTARHNIDRMTRYCGANRVRYLTCDVRDRDAVTGAIGTVLAAEPRVDLLINAAGRNRSKPFVDKGFAEFRNIRDLKVRGYLNLNLKHALRHRPPTRWCNFDSLLGFFGQRGEADYVSCNDFLATAAGYAAKVRAAHELTVGWTMWRDTRLVADELTSAYYEREGLYTGMDNDEGIDHFLRKLNTPDRAPHVVQLGAADRRTVARFYPSFFTAEPTGATHRGGYLGPPLVRTARR